jgi:hypothetical protein
LGSKGREWVSAGFPKSKEMHRLARRRIRPVTE